MNDYYVHRSRGDTPPWNPNNVGVARVQTSYSVDDPVRIRLRNDSEEALQGSDQDVPPAEEEEKKKKVKNDKKKKKKDVKGYSKKDEKTGDRKKKDHGKKGRKHGEGH